MTWAGARPIAFAMVASLAALMVAARPAVGRPTRAWAPGVQVKALASDTNGRVAAANLPQLPPLVVEPKAVTDTVLVAGRIATNLYAALDSCAATMFPLHARWKLAWSVADILEYRVDMSRDLRVGDTLPRARRACVQSGRWVPYGAGTCRHFRGVARHPDCDPLPHDGRVADRVRWPASTTTYMDGRCGPRFCAPRWSFVASRVGSECACTRF